MEINKYLNDFNEKGFCIIKNALSNNYVNNIIHNHIPLDIIIHGLTQ